MLALLRPKRTKKKMAKKKSCHRFHHVQQKRGLEVLRQLVTNPHHYFTVYLLLPSSNKDFERLCCVKLISGNTTVKVSI